MLGISCQLEFGERGNRHKRKEGRGGKRQFPMIICYALEDEARTGSHAHAKRTATFRFSLRISPVVHFKVVLAIARNFMA